MALKPTIFQAELEIADTARSDYHTHTLTVARHSSETDERLMVRLLAFARHAHELLAFSEGPANADEPAPRKSTAILKPDRFTKPYPRHSFCDRLRV